MTMAPSGSGKTFVRCAKFLATQFLPNEKGVSYSNFPFDVEAFVEHLEGVVEEDEVRRRLQSIPDDVLRQWENEESGPWEYFKGIDYQGAHIQIDEAHLYIGDSKKHQKKWRNWLVAVRHGKGTVEFITQDPENMPRLFVKLAATHILLMDTQSAVDPFFKIEMADWFQLKSKFTGHYTAYFFEKIKKRIFGVYVTQKNNYHSRDPKYFSLYDSYNQVGDVEGSQGEVEHEFQKRNMFSLLKWFYLKNFWTITLRGTAAVVFVTLVLLLPTFAKHGMAAFKKHQEQRMAKVEKRKSPRGKDKFGNPDYWPKPKLDSESVKLLQADNIAKDRAIAQLSSDYHKLRALHTEVITQITKAKAANDLIGMLFEDKAVTIGGRVVTVGDILNTLDGEKTIKGIDYEGAKITFSDDTDHWVTIGQRRVQESVTVPETQTPESGIQGTDRKGRSQKSPFRDKLSPRHSPSHRAAPIQRDFNSGQANGLHNHRDKRPTIYSRYVGPE